MDCRLFIYTGNHGKQDGIEDYLTLFKNVFGSRGFQIEGSSTLRANATNIILDEFTNCIENSRIAAFRKNNPNSRCIFVLTEFAGRKWGVESLNHFGGIFDSACIALFNIFLRLFRDDFSPVRARDVLVLLMHSPNLVAYFAAFFAKYLGLKLFGKKIGNPVGEFLRRHHRLIYFHMRYLGLKAHLQYADAVITSHEFIMRGFTWELGINGERLKFLGVIYPSFDEQRVLKSLMEGKKPFMEITGSTTVYRQKILGRVNTRIMLLGVNNIFGRCKFLPFSLLASGKQLERAAYSLHPPQTRSWPYSSPTRIYRALEVDHNLPVLTKHFSQNPIEDVCFVLKDQRSVIEMVEMYFDRTSLLDFMAPRIRRYNEIVKQRNDLVVKSLLEISKT